MSTSSKPKCRAPAHQNRTAFRHNKNSKKTKQIAESATTFGLCEKCSDKINWRLKYRKYKPLTAPRKCNRCDRKAVKAAYRTICGACAGAAGACAGCGQTRAVDTEQEATRADEMHEENAMREVLRGLTERQRRAVQRQVERGEDELEAITRLVGADESESDDDDDVDNGEEEED